MNDLSPTLTINYSSDFSVKIELSQVRRYELVLPEYCFRFFSRIHHSKGEFTYVGRDICFDPQTFRNFAEQLNAIRTGKAQRAEFHEVGYMIEFSIEIQDRKTEACLRIKEYQPHGQLTVLSAAFQVDYDLFVNALYHQAAEFSAEMSVLVDGTGD